jgi:hypothetical protein
MGEQNPLDGRFFVGRLVKWQSTRYPFVLRVFFIFLIYFRRAVAANLSNRAVHETQRKTQPKTVD